MQFQIELLHSRSEFRPKLISIRLTVKSNHDVVRESHHDDIAVRPLRRQLGPKSNSGEIDVSQQRRGTTALGVPSSTRIRFPSSSTPALAILDQSHDAPVRDPVPDDSPAIREIHENAMSTSSTQFTFS
jgi:hypothetical protein